MSKAVFYDYWSCGRDGFSWTSGLAKLDTILTAGLKLCDFVQSSRCKTIVSSLEEWITSETKRSDSTQDQLRRIEDLLKTLVTQNESVLTAKSARPSGENGATTVKSDAKKSSAVTGRNTSGQRPSVTFLFRLKDKLSLALDKIIYASDPRTIEITDTIFTKFANKSLQLDDVCELVRVLGYDDKNIINWLSSPVQELLAAIPDKKMGGTESGSVDETVPNDDTTQLRADIDLLSTGACC